MSGRAAGPLTAAPTATGTEPGTVMGTVGYMSPEQVRGDAMDARTDIFSFGCVLHEMLTGRRAFQRRTAADTMAAILNAEPARSTRGIDRELSGEPGRRHGAVPSEEPARAAFRSARDLVFALKESLRGSDAATGAPVSSGSQRRALESIAVLPFANVGGDPETEYLSDGIAESIINSLSRLPSLRVMASSTLSRYKRREVDPQAVGEELKVRAVLTGRVFHRGESLVIKTELVDVRDGSQIWGENYSRKFTDILALEEEIAREISGKLRLKVTGEDAERLTRRATESPEAYRLYLKGLFYWNKRTAEGLRKGIELFQQAIDVDPEYALAYAGVAHSYNQLGFYQYLSPQESYPKARAAATRALELDASLGEARTVLGMVRFWYDWDWSGAEEEIPKCHSDEPQFPPRTSLLRHFPHRDGEVPGRRRGVALRAGAGSSLFARPGQSGPVPLPGAPIRRIDRRNRTDSRDGREFRRGAPHLELEPISRSRCGLRRSNRQVAPWSCRLGARCAWPRFARASRPRVAEPKRKRSSQSSSLDLRDGTSPPSKSHSYTSHSVSPTSPSSGSRKPSTSAPGAWCS